MPSATTTSLITLTLLTLTSARTDLSGCTSSTAGPSIIYYVPGTGELCSFLDCGGGRAPPKTTVPGCPQYVGTATYSPSFLPGFGGVESTSFVAATTTPVITGSGGLSTGAGDGDGDGVVTLTGTVRLSSTSTAVVSESLSPASQTTSSASSSSSGSGTGTGAGTSTGTATGATNTNAGSLNAVHGVVGAVAAGVAFLL